MIIKKHGKRVNAWLLIPLVYFFTGFFRKYRKIPVYEMDWKVHYCRFKNLPISSSWRENNMSKISH